MKKIYIAIAAIAAAALVSCEREQSFEGLTPLGENDIAFTLKGMTTRSGVSSGAVKGVTIPLGNTGSGEALYLEESIEELNPNPATKGAPAYTVNVGTLYSTMGVYAAGNFGDTSFEVMDMYQHDKYDASLGDGWRYYHSYASNPWPDETTPVDFYLRMPAAGEGVTISGYASNATSLKLTSPLNGASQQDLLFGQTSISKAQHDDYLPNGAPVTMYHALSAVKFRNGHTNDHQTKTIITRVELIGLKGYGEGTVAADGTASWDATKLSTPSTATAPFYLDFANPTYTAADGASNVDGTVGPAAEGETPGDYNWNSNLVGTSWTGAAADHNLNDADGTLTFWFIPQEITDDVILKVYFRIKTPDTPEGTLVPHTIMLGELLNEGRSQNVKWEAGQLRTYTLKPFDVDVEIEDVITADKKSNLHIANTGNVDEYVRMLIMGNWYGWESEESKENGDEPSILVGYRYAGTEEGLTDEQKKEMILPWFREGYDGVDPYGTFDSTFLLANLGSRDGKKNDWADASGGFYYTMPIGPGEGVGDAVASATTDLFKSYTVTSVPTIYIATNGVQRTPAVGVHLVMEIVIQAIAVPKDDNGNDKWWLQAWYEATGIDKLDPDAARNQTYKNYYLAGEYDEE